MTEAIEPLRREKTVRSSLEAEVTVPDDCRCRRTIWPRCSSSPRSTTAPEVTVTRTDYDKCGRCWRHLPEVTADGALCDRCASVVAVAA